MTIRHGAIALAATGSLLAGCASLPADRGASEVGELLAGRTAAATAVPWQPGTQDGSTTQPAGLLAGPVDEDAAVRVALQSSPRMRMLYAELGFAQADVYEATRLSNPTLGYERLSVSSGGAQSTWSLSQGFMEVLFARHRGRMGELAWLEARQHVAHQLLRLEADVRMAWQAHAAASLASRLRAAAAHAAQLSAELAARFHAAGNVAALQLAREQAAAGQALIAERSQQAELARSRAALLTLIGVEDAPGLIIDDRLALPVPLQASLPVLQSTALAQRLDLQSLRTRVQRTAGQQDQAHNWRWVSGLTVEATRERDADGSSASGGGLSLELPIFNTGAGRALRATAVHETATAVLAGAELDVKADVAASLAALEAATHNVNEYRERQLPLHQRIVELMQERQNYMLVGAFEALDARRQDIEAWQGYIAALRDYAQARTGLARALGGALPATNLAPEYVTIPQLPAATRTGETP